MSNIVSRFFGLEEAEETYTQVELAEFYAMFLRDGYFPGVGNELVVTESPGAMDVDVDTGKGWLRGYWCKVTDTETLTINPAHPTNPRIDRVILRLNVLGKNITLNIIEGTPATNPVAPTLTRTSTTWDLSLARVLVGAGVTSITNANITSERNNPDLCGKAIPYFAGEALAQNLDADNNWLIMNLPEPFLDGHAANKQYADTKLAKTGGEMSGDLTVRRNLPVVNLRSENNTSAGVRALNSAGTEASSIAYVHAAGEWRIVGDKIWHAGNSLTKTYGNISYTDEILASGTLEKTIAITAGKNHGMAVISNSGNSRGITVHFGTDNEKTKATGWCAFFSGLNRDPYHRGSSWTRRRLGTITEHLIGTPGSSAEYVGLGSTGNSAIRINEFYIDGSQIKVLFENMDSQPRNLNITIDWEVW